MAASRDKHPAIGGLAAGLLAATAWVVAAPLPAPATAPASIALPRLAADEPIQLDARSSDFDYRSNTLVFHGIRIAQGGLAIESDEATATGLDFKDSLWVFRGHVRITVPDGSLDSDEARVAFAANAIATATASGSPAAFEQRREKGLARGHAGHIDYDFSAGTVRLSDDAWLSDGNNEITGQSLVYSPRDQRVRAYPDEQGSQRVRITINPPMPVPKPNP